MTAVMLAAENGHKDVDFILAQKGAKLDLVDKVMCICYMRQSV